MKTLDLANAAALLHIHPETLRRRARAGEIPGARVGRAWVFVEADLADWLRARYADPARAATGGNVCSIVDRKPAHGGADSRHPTGGKYAEVLALSSGKRRKNGKLG
jgi:excisionase family DNA binding protein